MRIRTHAYLIRDLQLYVENANSTLSKAESSLTVKKPAKSQIGAVRLALVAVETNLVKIRELVGILAEDRISP